jgi:methyltransferase-like protein
MTENTSRDTSYDEIPYESHPFPQTHPERLATIGRLFGMSPAPVTQCRVLELGCGNGGNLIPMAYSLPESQFVGVDLSKQHAERGWEGIRDLGLRNIRIEHASVTEIDESWGTFDYIICHGVYSWVANEVQEKILSISSKNLKPQGIAYISYNTYPGWHLRGMIRHMMLYHALQFKDTSNRIKQARALIDFLEQSVSSDKPVSPLLKDEIKVIRESKDWYLFHEHMEEFNVPLYFHQFVERAEKHDMQYLGEAEFATMMTSGFPQEVSDTLNRISRDIIRVEQYMDFLRYRYFRRTLLCHKEQPLERNLKTLEMQGFLISSAAKPSSDPVNLSPGVKESFRLPSGANIETEFPITKAAFLVLKEQWPRAIEMSALFEKAKREIEGMGFHKKENDGELRRVLFVDLLHCYSLNLVEFHTWQGNFTNEILPYPKTSRLSQYFLSKRGVTVNQRHMPVHLDPVSIRLVPVLDGTRNQDELMDYLMTSVDEGKLILKREKIPLNEKGQFHQALKEAMEGAFVKLSTSAMLVA